MAFTVSEVARQAGVSVRTLHHYDELGLLRPSGRSEAGYRLYEHADLQRLQQILFFRELGFALEHIAKILADPAFDVRAALLMQREVLQERRLRLQALVETIDETLRSIERGETMSSKELIGVFGDFEPERYEEEAKQRWGDTDAYRESQRRTSRYGKRDWERIQAEAGELYRRLAELMSMGVAATAPEALEAAEAHRAHISRWFYPCAPPMHAGLGELYASDPRFTATIDRFGEGLSQYLRDAFRENASRVAGQA